MVTIKEAQAMPDKTPGVSISGVITYVNKVWPGDKGTMQKITVKDDTGRIDVTFRGQPEIFKTDMNKVIEVSGGYMGTYKEYRTMLTREMYKLNGAAQAAVPSQGHQAVSPTQPAQVAQQSQIDTKPVYEDKEYWMSKQRRKDFFFALSYAKDVFIAGLIDLDSVANLAYNWVCDGYEDTESPRKPINGTKPVVKIGSVPPTPGAVFSTRIGMCATLDSLNKLSDEIVNFQGKITPQEMKEISDAIDAKKVELIKTKLQ